MKSNSHLLLALSVGIALAFTLPLSASDGMNLLTETSEKTTIQESETILLNNCIPEITNQSIQVKRKISSNIIEDIPADSGPGRDDPREDWIIYDDGDPLSQTEVTNYWSRVSFTATSLFTLQSISFMAKDLGFNDDSPCEVQVYQEIQDNHDLDELLWETEIEELPEWDNDDIDENWHTIDIAEDDWMQFEAGEHFSIVYGVVPGGEYNGLQPWDFTEEFEDYDVDDVPDQNYCSVERNGQSRITVSDDDSHTGEKSLHFVDPRDADMEYCVLWLNPNVDMELSRLDFWVKIPEAGEWGYRGYSDDNDMIFVWEINENRSITSNNGERFIVADGRFEWDEWTHVVAEWSLEDENFSIWMNDEVCVDENSLFTNAPVGKLMFICFGNLTVDDVYMDDIAIRYDLGEDLDYGWWNTFDEETEVERSFICDNRELQVEHDSWDLLEGDLLLRANGDYQQPEISIENENIDFGAVLLEESEEFNLVIENVGDGDLNVSSIEIEGDYFDHNFEEAIVIEPENQIEVTVAFTPEESGEYEGTLLVNSDDPENGEITIQLTGIGNIAPVVDEQIEDVTVDEDPGRVDIADLDDIFSDPDNNELSFTIEEGAPEQLNLAIEENFNILYFDPTDNYNLPDGVDISIVANDIHEATAQVSFTITILPVNDPPSVIGEIEDIHIMEDQDPRRTNVADLDELFIDPDGDALVFTVENAPEELNIELNRFNLLFFEPVDNFNIPNGIEITVTAIDETGLRANLTFNIFIESVNDLPTAFDLSSPENESRAGDPDGVNFVWNRSIDVVEESQVTYALVLYFNNEENWITDLADTSEILSRQDLVIDPDRATEVEWWVWAYDDIDSVRSSSVFNVTVEPLSAPHGDETIIPNELSLAKIYPNPFNSTVRIEYDIPEVTDVNVSVYDLNGNLTKVLVNQNMNAGKYRVTWDGFNSSGLHASSGTYLCRLQTGNEKIIRRIMLIR
ncbi:MAG: T9SS type A sorting domain-containing protein [Candidatus Hatepunaea meridiana]|nr:T9SS type A sorting domain-containing protein [Candidatus Hatepunaea meridiana]